MKRFRLWIAFAASLLGLVLAGFSGYQVFASRAPSSHYVQVKGAVVSIDMPPNSDRVTAVCTYRYGGRTYEAVGSYHCDSPENAIEECSFGRGPGDPVTVLVDPEHPERSKVFDSIPIELSFGLVGAAILMLAGFPLVLKTYGVDRRLAIRIAISLALICCVLAFAAFYLSD